MKGKKKGKRFASRESRGAEEQQSLLAAIVESSGDAIVSKSLTGIVTSWNAAAESLFGYSAPEMIGQPIQKMIPDERDLEADTIVNGVHSGRNLAHYETVAITMSGNEIPVSATLSPIKDSTGRVVGASIILRDITEQKRKYAALREAEHKELVAHAADLEVIVAERTAQLQQRSDQVRELALQLTRVEEAERRRIAKVLHDQVQQYLVGAGFLTESISVEAASATIREMAQAATTALKDALAATTTMTSELSPAILQSSSLREILLWLARWMEERHKLRVNVRAQEIDIGQPGMREFIVRSVQELLFNVVKHAGVREAVVRTTNGDGRVRLVISDQGQGCDPRALRQYRTEGGSGLYSVLERAKLFGGVCRVDSAPGKGMRVILEFPSVLSPTTESRDGKSSRRPATSAIMQTG